MTKKIMVFTILIIMLTLPAWAKKVSKYISEGNIYINEGDYPKAIKCYNEALKIDPHNRDAWYYQAKAYQCMNDWDNANYCCNKVLEINSNDIAALLLGGNIYYLGFGDSNLALGYYERVLTIDPYNSYAKNWKKKISCKNNGNNGYYKHQNDNGHNGNNGNGNGNNGNGNNHHHKH